MDRDVRALCWATLVAALLFGYFVWPTPYEIRNFREVPCYVHRLTGRAYPCIVDNDAYKAYMESRDRLGK